MSGFRSATERQVATMAAGRGWQLADRTSRGVLLARWPATGAILPVPASLGPHELAKTRSRMRRIERGPHA